MDKYAVMMIESFFTNRLTLPTDKFFVLINPINAIINNHNFIINMLTPNSES